jgi:hypothetical protein
MMFREVTAVYFMNPTIPISTNTVCVSSVEFLKFKVDGVFCAQSPLKSKISGDHNPIKNVLPVLDSYSSPSPGKLLGDYYWLF